MSKQIKKVKSRVMVFQFGAVNGKAEDARYVVFMNSAPIPVLSKLKQAEDFADVVGLFNEAAGSGPARFTYGDIDDAGADLISLIKNKAGIEVVHERYTYVDQIGSLRERTEAGRTVVFEEVTHSGDLVVYCIDDAKRFIGFKYAKGPKGEWRANSSESWSMTALGATNWAQDKLLQANSPAVHELLTEQ